MLLVNLCVFYVGGDNEMEAIFSSKTYGLSPTVWSENHLQSLFFGVVLMIEMM